MSIKEILAMDYSQIVKLDRTELAKLTVQLGSAANKRFKRAQDHELKSPAYRAFEKAAKTDDARITVKGKDRNEVLAEYKRAYKYLTSKTSTQKGFQEYRKETFKRLGGKPMTIPEEKAFWSAYNKLLELDPASLQYVTSTQIQQELREIQIQDPTADVDGLLEKGSDMLNDMYELAQENMLEEFEDDDTKGFTIIGNNADVFFSTPIGDIKNVLSERHVHKHTGKGK